MLLFVVFDRETKKESESGGKGGRKRGDWVRTRIGRTLPSGAAIRSMPTMRKERQRLKHLPIEL